MQFKSCNTRKLRGQRLIGFTLLELVGSDDGLKGPCSIMPALIPLTMAVA